jgi:WD40 repeat protein
MSVVFSADGRRLASASADQTIRLWDPRTHRQIGRPLRGHTALVNSVAFSRDGGTLASASVDHTVGLWDVRAHKMGSPLRGHTGPVESVAFSPDGRALASGADDHTIRLWDRILWRSFAELQSEVCGLVGSGLSKAEWTQYAGGIPYRRSCP